jgi:hypothetical protein
MIATFEALPYRIFLDSCTVQTLRDYGGYIYDGGSIPDNDRIHCVVDGYAKVEALRDVCLVTQRAMFEWIVSDSSFREARDKGDLGHLPWFYEIANYTRSCLERGGPRAENDALARRLDEPRFGCLSAKDRELLREAVSLQCDSFLTMERRLPQNSAHICRHLGIRVLTPIGYWEMLRPWAALWN